MSERYRPGSLGPQPHKYLGYMRSWTLYRMVVHLLTDHRAWNGPTLGQMHRDKHAGMPAKKR